VFLIELLRPFLRWLFWKKWRPWVLLVAVILVVAAIVRVAAGGTGHPAGPAGGNPSPASTASAPAHATVTPAVVSSPSSPPSSPAALPAAAGTVNIYSWLPFTQQDLAAAASVTERFGVDYDTFTFTETAAAYAGKMNGLITGQFATTLRADYSDPGVARLRTGQRQVSTGTTVINSLRAFGPSSITFIITENQRIVSAHGTTAGSAQYAVTVNGSGAGWLVNDVELASEGNE
jgi:hypothetical protein